MFSGHKVIRLGGRRARLPAFLRHPRSLLRDSAPFLLSAREENLETAVEGSVRFAAVGSDVLESVRIARVLFAKVSQAPFKGDGDACPIILSFGVRSACFRFLCWVLWGTSSGRRGSGAGEGWLNAAANKWSGRRRGSPVSFSSAAFSSSGTSPDLCFEDCSFS